MTTAIFDANKDARLKGKTSVPQKRCLRSLESSAPSFLGQIECERGQSLECKRNQLSAPSSPAAKTPHELASLAKGKVGRLNERRNARSDDGGKFPSPSNLAAVKLSRITLRLIHLQLQYSTIQTCSGTELKQFEVQTAHMF